jgi:hypothetical protein
MGETTETAVGWTRVVTGSLARGGRSYDRMKRRLAESPRWGWLSREWMLPWRYRLPVAAGLIAIGYASLRLATDVDEPLLLAMFTAGLILLIADYFWWRRARGR